jgi:uncharacterized membrane protein YqjE
LAPDSRDHKLAEAIQDVTSRAQLLIQEEIALAKAELTEKITKLIKGAVVGIVAGVFALLALMHLLQALAWGSWDLLRPEGNDGFWLGFLVVAVLLLLLGAIAGFLALKFVKGGTPPTPQMAIEEGKLIKQTIASSKASVSTRPAQTVSASSATPAAPAAPAAYAASQRPEGEAS